VTHICQKAIFKHALEHVSDTLQPPKYHRLCNTGMVY
jgi:hypothetical protein